MGATRNTGYLENLIAYDASNNVAIATTAIDNAFKITMGGSVKMTGALSGTSATFSGNVEIGNTSGSAINNASGLGNLVVGNGGASSQGITIYTGASTYGGLNFADATSGGGAYAGYIKFDHSDNSMGFFIGNVSRLSLASTGAATFSSSVTAGGKITINKDLEALTISGGTSANAAYMSFQANTQAGWLIVGSQGATANYIQTGTSSNESAITTVGAYALTFGTNQIERMRITSGGNVVVGDTSDYSVRMHVAGVGATTSTGNGSSNIVMLLRDTTAGAINVGAGIGFAGNDGANTGVTFATINGRKENSTSGNYASYLAFQTRVDGGALTERMRITSGGNVLIGTTSDQGRLTVANSACIVVVQSTTSTQFNGLEMKNGGGSFYFGQDNSSGTFYGSNAAYAGSLYMSGNYPMVFFTNQTERMRITSGGNVGIGSNNPLCLLQAGSIGNSTVRLGTSSTTNTSTSSAFAAWNSSGQDILTARGDGLVAFAKINDFTTGNSPNTWINPSPSYGIYINTSSIRYKRDIVDYDKGLSTVSQLRPVYYKGKSEVDGDKQFAGFIAEEIDALGLTEFVNYLEDGRPNSLSYPNMVALLTKAIQELNQKIEALENK